MATTVTVGARLDIAVAVAVSRDDEVAVTLGCPSVAITEVAGDVSVLGGSNGSAGEGWSPPLHCLTKLSRKR